ncbi:MAG TPA: NB-ARC domain-containing protein, partial [Thermomicrobiales bacterium]|nr:NB-ARC domain-containing protein [Thermomicrobiales bacterium]
MSAALDLLRSDTLRILTLTGPGGIGKTRLALEIAAQSDFPFVDGIAWVPLATIRDPDLLVAAIGRALSISETHRPVSLDAVISALHDQRMLLVLDNFEQIVAAAPQVAEIARACPRIAILTTSRSPLRIAGEHVLPLPPLDLPSPQDRPSPDRLRDVEAVRLFVDRAEAVSPSFRMDQNTAPLVARICQRLDGLPLAIELAAARMYHLSAETLHDRLTNRLPLLTGGPRDLPARQQTLRDTIAWSHDLLSPEEQTLFRQLSVFVGGFTIEAAEAISSDQNATVDHLTALVDMSLVQHQPDAPGGARYALL